MSYKSSDKVCLSTKQTLMISLITAAVFLVIGNPMTYKLTNALLTKISNSLATVDGSTVGTECAGTPSIFGVVLHTAVAFGVSYLVFNTLYACVPLFGKKDKKN